MFAILGAMMQGAIVAQMVSNESTMGRGQSLTASQCSTVMLVAGFVDNSPNGCFQTLSAVDRMNLGRFRLLAVVNRSGGGLCSTFVRLLFL